MLNKQFVSYFQFFVLVTALFLLSLLGFGLVVVLRKVVTFCILFIFAHLYKMCVHFCLFGVLYCQSNFQYLFTGECGRVGGRYEIAEGDVYGSSCNRPYLYCMEHSDDQSRIVIQHSTSVLPA